MQYSWPFIYEQYGYIYISYLNKVKYTTGTSDQELRLSLSTQCKSHRNCFSSYLILFIQYLFFSLLFHFLLKFWQSFPYFALNHQVIHCMTVCHPPLTWFLQSLAKYYFFKSFTFYLTSYTNKIFLFPFLVFINDLKQGVSGKKGRWKKGMFALSLRFPNIFNK